MSTCAISNQADQKHRAEREKIYMNTVRKYSKDDTFRIKDMLWLEPTCYKTGRLFLFFDFIYVILSEDNIVAP